MQLTVFTTTYNRVHLLARLYNSLCKQTCKDFVWLIVDDGSTDGTQDWMKRLVAGESLIGSSSMEGFTSEGIHIDYLYKQNGGKHTAMKLGFESTKTKYMLEIDDDDELLPNAVETFVKEWKNIEDDGLENIAEIRALSISDTGHISGVSQDAKLDGSCYDSNYLVEDWHKGRHFENVTSWNMELVKPLHLFDIEDMWLHEQVKLVSESLFWNRLARRYDTRYIDLALRLYHADSGDSITLSKFTGQKCLNYVFSLCGIINELGKEGWRNRRHFLKYIAEYLCCGLAVRISPAVLLRHLKNPLVRGIAFLIMPLAYAMSFRIKK